MKDINFYRAMKDGLYRCRVDRAALYDSSASALYTATTYISNTGEYKTLPDEITVEAISILTMIEVIDRGYTVELLNTNMVKEIFDITYSHITRCIQAKNDDVYGVYNVPDEDLIKMESFLKNIYDTHKITLGLLHDDETLSNMYDTNFMNPFDKGSNDSITTIDNTMIARVSPTKNNMNLRELLNSLD